MYLVSYSGIAPRFPVAGVFDCQLSIGPPGTCGSALESCWAQEYDPTRPESYNVDAKEKKLCIFLNKFLKKIFKKNKFRDEWKHKI